MLDYPDNKNISVHKYDQEILPTSMLELWSYINYS